MDFKTFYAVISSLLICSIILNSCGINVLCSRRRHITSHSIILVNLSITEIVGATVWFLRDSVLMIGRSETALRIFSILMIILLHVRSVWYLSMYIILLDRLIACIWPLKHMVIITKHRVKTALAVIWLVFILSAIPFSIFDVKYFKMVFTREVFLAMAGGFLLFAVITYATIFFKVIRSNVNLSQGRSQNRGGHLMYVASLIIVTFIIFEVIPSIVGFLNKGPLPSADFLHASALLTDPIIYVLFKRDVRAVAQSLRRIASKRVAGSSNVESASNAVATSQPSNRTDDEIRPSFITDQEPIATPKSKIAVGSSCSICYASSKKVEAPSSQIDSNFAKIGIANSAFLEESKGGEIVSKSVLSPLAFDPDKNGVANDSPGSRVSGPKCSCLRNERSKGKKRLLNDDTSQKNEKGRDSPKEGETCPLENSFTSQLCFSCLENLERKIEAPDVQCSCQISLIKGFDVGEALIARHEEQRCGKHEVLLPEAKAVELLNSFNSQSRDGTPRINVQPPFNSTLYRTDTEETVDSQCELIAEEPVEKESTKL